MIPYFQVVSYAFSRSKKIDTTCFIQKSLSYTSLKMQKVIYCASCFTEATLAFHDECRGFKKPNKRVINNAFSGHTDRTGQCYRAVVICMFGVFSWLGNRYDGGLSPGGRKLPSLQNTIKDSLKETEEKLQEDVLKFGNVYDPDQQLCHGICQGQS